MPIHIINQSLDKVTFPKLKHLRDLEMDFSGNNVTGIFGVNGCGKSSILHAIACFYRSLNNGSETNYFTRFFKRVGTEAWTDSRMTVKFTINGTAKTMIYRKGDDRWIPRAESKPQRDTYFVGINSCVPAVEKEPLTRTSFHMTNRGAIAHHAEVVDAFSNIMCRVYSAAEREEFLKKRYARVRLSDATTYTSLSMGTGEQRLLQIIELLYNVPEYSLILIDELDLTLHTMALNRLVDLIVRISNEKHLQVIFTSHRESLTRRKDINVRHIWKPANVDQTCNAFSIAAGFELQGAVDGNKLILIDGDVYTTQDERLRQMRKKIGGNEAGRDDIRNHALTLIKQLILPAGEQPEHYIWTLLKTKQGELADFANMVDQSPDDQHHYLYDIYEMQGENKTTYYRNVVKTIKEDEAWNGYVREITDWIAQLQ